MILLANTPYSLVEAINLAVRFDLLINLAAKYFFDTYYLFFNVDDHIKYNRYFVAGSRRE